jgi:hypothetical protein
MGHEERFAPARLSDGCGFRKETIAGMRRNGRDAPKAVVGRPVGYLLDRYKADVRRREIFGTSRR